MIFAETGMSFEAMVRRWCRDKMRRGIAAAAANISSAELLLLSAESRSLVVCRIWKEIRVFVDPTLERTNVPNHRINHDGKRGRKATIGFNKRKSSMGTETNT